jgi:integrase
MIGFAGAFRRSEIVRLQVRDLQTSDAGLIITLRRSKTDQEGASFTRRTLLHRPNAFSAVRCASVTPRKPVISILRQVRIQRCSS